MYISQIFHCTNVSAVPLTDFRLILNLGLKCDIFRTCILFFANDNNSPTSTSVNIYSKLRHMFVKYNLAVVAKLVSATVRCVTQSRGGIFKIRELSTP